MDSREGRLLDPDNGRHTEEAWMRHSDYINRKQSKGQKGLNGGQKARPRKREGCIKKTVEKYKLHLNKIRLPT